MIDIDRLIGRTDIEKGHIKDAAHIETVDALWGKVGADPDHGLEQIAGIDQNRLLILLAAQAVQEAEMDDGSWLNAHGALRLTLRNRVWWKWLQRRWKFYWTEWLAVIVAVSLAVVGIQVRHSLTPATARQVVVLPGAGLPPYHVITRRDIIMKVVPKQSGVITKEADLLGHVTLQRLAHDAVIQSTEVSTVSLPKSDQQVLKTRKVLTVALDLSSVAAPVTAGDHVTLLLSPRTAKSGAGMEVDDVLLLAVNMQGTNKSLVMAAPATDVSKLLQLLGSSTVIVVAPPG